jgi:hypothetical protein
MGVAIVMAALPIRRFYKQLAEITVAEVTGKCDGEHACVKRTPRELGCPVKLP